MLDVTASDIANVNTVGYKGERTSFKDALSQLQKGANGAGTTLGGTNAGPGRPRRAAELDRQPDELRRDPVDRQPVRPRDPGRRLVPGHGRPDRLLAHLLHARRQLHAATSTATSSRQDGYYVVGKTRRPARTRRSRSGRRSTRSAIGQNGAVTTVTGGVSTAVATLSLAKFPNDAGPPARRRATASPPRTTPARRRSRRPAMHAGLRPDHARRDRDVERRPRAGVHEHDHRPARVPGEQPRHLDRRRDAPGAREPEALTADHRGGRRLFAPAPALFQGGRTAMIAVHRLTHPGAARSGSTPI